MSPACPVCGSERSKLLHTFTAQDAAAYFVGEPGSEAVARVARKIERLWQRDHADQLDCADCGFGYTHPFVAGDADFYDEIYGTEGYPKTKWEFDRTLQALSDAGIATGEGVDIGCGMGYFLDQAAAWGYPKDRLTGLDYNSDGLARIRERGYKVGSPDLDQFSSGQFQNIFMFQVLEHSASLDRMFSDLSRILQPGGNIFVAVPNPDLIAFNTESGSLPDVPPNHIGRWNRPAFDIMAKRFGLHLRTFEIEPFSLRQAVTMDIRYAYVQRARRGEGIASMLYGNRRTVIGKALNTAAAGVNGLSRLPVWAKMMTKRARLGENNWVHLVKPVG